MSLLCILSLSSAVLWQECSFGVHAPDEVCKGWKVLCTLSCVRSAVSAFSRAAAPLTAWLHLPPGSCIIALGMIVLSCAWISCATCLEEA